MLFQTLKIINRLLCEVRGEPLCRRRTQKLVELEREWSVFWIRILWDGVG